MYVFETIAVDAKRFSEPSQEMVESLGGQLLPESACSLVAVERSELLHEGNPVSFENIQVSGFAPNDKLEDCTLPEATRASTALEKAEEYQEALSKSLEGPELAEPAAAHVAGCTCCQRRGQASLN